VNGVITLVRKATIPLAVRAAQLRAAAIRHRLQFNAGHHEMFRYSRLA
jgi:hypothetical protein